MPEMSADSDETRSLLDQVKQGNRQALDQLLARHRPMLVQFVDNHLDPAIRRRVDPSDVVQETQMEIVRRMDDFLNQEPMPFRVWLRKKAYDRLLNLRRDHLRDRRSVKREVAWPERSSLLLAKPLLTRQLSPSQQAEARELAVRVSAAVARLADADREILMLRHAEQLPFEEIACLLELTAAAARKRFGRALIRLQKALSDEGVVE
jgi:RNA polymerase sigma-70 factor, ECF subfamily